MLTLNNIEYDTLKEIASIGGGNASKALSDMINKQIDVEIPELKITPVKKINELIGKAENVVTIVLIKLVGDLSGTTLFIFEPKDAMALADFLNNRTNRTSEVLDETDRSALNEVGNILAGASFNALSSFLNITLLQSTPEIITDMIVTIMDNIIPKFKVQTEEVLLMKVRLSAEDSKLSMGIYFIFDPQSTENIIAATRKILN